MGTFEATIRIKVAALLKSNTVTLSTVSIFSLNMVYHRFQCFRAVNCPVCPAGTLSPGPGKAVFQATYNMKWIKLASRAPLASIENLSAKVLLNPSYNNVNSLFLAYPMHSNICRRATGLIISQTCHKRSRYRLPPTQHTNAAQTPCHSIANHIETLTV